MKAALILILLLVPVKGQPPTPEHLQFFEKAVRPLLVARCQSCHNATTATAGLDLTRAQPDGSRLLRAVS